MERFPEEWPYKIKGKRLENVFSHWPTDYYKIYGHRPYILKDHFDMMFYLLFYKVNVFSYILYGHSLSH